MKSAIIKHSISVGGHKTSVSLEPPFWDGLREIADRRSQTVSQVIAEIDSRREQGNLSSTIRLYVLDHVRATAEANADTAAERAAGPMIGTALSGN